MSSEYKDNEENPWTLIIIVLIILFAVLFFIAMIGLRPEIRSTTQGSEPANPNKYQGEEGSEIDPSWGL